jgi:hypothetical protein
MRTVCAMVGLLLLGLGVAGLGADVNLVYKMAQGEKVVYNCASNGGGSLQVAGQTEPLRISAQFRYVMECTAVGEQGEMTLVHRLEDVQAKALRGDQPMPVDLNMPAMVTTITPSGRVLHSEVQKAEAGGEGMGLGAMLGGQLGGMGAGSQFDVAQFYGALAGPGFPTAGVHPGSRWKDSMVMTNEAGQTLTVNYTTTLLDYAALNERTCARLQTDYEAPLSMSLMGGELFNLTGKTKGSQIAYFDYAAGRLVRSDGTSDTTITMSVPQLFGGGQPVSATAGVRMLTTVVLEEG